MAFSVGTLGSGIGSIFGAFGDLSEASSYQDAAKYAGQNAQIAAESTAIQEFQAQRKITQTIGAGVADTAGNGLKVSGSSLDILHESAAQGSLTKNLISLQGQIDVNGYKEAQSQYNGMASAANSAGIGGILGGIATIAGMFI